VRPAIQPDFGPALLLSALVVARHVALNGAMRIDPTTPAPLSPEALILAVGRHRDRVAFRSLFELFAPRVKAYIARLGCDAATAEELMQEAMVTVWRRAETYDPAQAGAATWVFTIARSKRIDLARREKRPQLDPDDPMLVPSSEPPADQRIAASQTEARLRTAIAALPENQRDLLALAFYEDKPHSEIAVVRNLPLGTVKSRIRLALERLRLSLTEAGND
jgi:RNA polymerase sigma-70 factor (ECF subfamily)